MIKKISNDHFCFWATIFHEIFFYEFSSCRVDLNQRPQELGVGAEAENYDADYTISCTYIKELSLYGEREILK